MKKEKNNRNKNTVMVAAALLVATIIITACIAPETALRFAAAVTIAVVYRLSKDTSKKEEKEMKTQDIIKETSATEICALVFMSVIPRIGDAPQNVKI